MDLNFLFLNDIEQLISNREFSYSGDLNETRGLYYVRSGNSYVVINLEAEQWTGFINDELLTQLGKTVTHETCHYAIDITDFEGRVTPDGEEWACKILAGQDDRPFVLSKTESFK